MALEPASIGFVIRAWSFFRHLSFVICHYARWSFATYLALHIMIITRSPLRISLGGGGTDLPSYYREHGGFLIAAAIDKYVYLTVHQTFVPFLIIKYSKLERVETVDTI